MTRTGTRIHILGIGSIGTLVAHHLQLSSPAQPMSLLVRSPNTFPTSLSSTRGSVKTTSSGYNIESSISSSPSLSDRPIKSLLIATKTTQTSSALEPLIHRLNENSVITLLQNGMGVYQELISNFFQDERQRPHFILGTTPHAVSPSEQKGQIYHHSAVGDGFIKWGLVHDSSKNIGETTLEDWLWDYRSKDAHISSQHLEKLEIPNGRDDLVHLKDTMASLLDMNDLNSQLLPYEDLNHAILLKLVVNAAVNPLTAILGRGQITNGKLKEIPYGINIVDQIVKESSEILLKYLDLESAVPMYLEKFGYENLKKIVYDTIEATRLNTTSMAVDIREKRKTEIDYINGYLVKMGEELGFKTDINRMICDMIKFIEEEQKLSN
ncbi:hypothetical protein L486_08090 [Kwoniella mangroviensis CBS 10435]|uniref:2-dehydropantoate 2-reductase n=1 Tax=Kwoniella mangroviensis CBS 10435 TaxID=1331196 RepID=A0A1B9IGS5_9TREE|nr:hypothetical protein L486_08090 [Kwoniella mangroviensis CBS 10435]